MPSSNSPSTPLSLELQAVAGAGAPATPSAGGVGMSVACVTLTFFNGVTVFGAGAGASCLPSIASREGLSWWAVDSMIDVSLLWAAQVSVAARASRGSPKSHCVWHPFTLPAQCSALPERDATACFPGALGT